MVMPWVYAVQMSPGLVALMVVNHYSEWFGATMTGYEMLFVNTIYQEIMSC